MALEEWQNPIVQQIGCRDWCLGAVELGKRHLGVGVHEGLLVDPANAF